MSRALLALGVAGILLGIAGGIAACSEARADSGVGVALESAQQAVAWTGQRGLDAAEAVAGFVPPITLSQQVSAQLGVSIEVPRALASLSASEVVDIVRALPAGVPLEAVQMVPGVGPAYVDSFTVSCDSDATEEVIQPSGGAMISYTCQNVSTTIVGIGDQGLADPDSGTRNSPVYCATNCPSQEFGGNARIEFCRSDSGTVVLYCRGLVAVSSAP